MKTNRSTEIYALGPTACAPNPKVIKSITKQIKENRIVSVQELRIARRMGLVATSPVASRIGFNDGVLYPYDEASGAPAGAMRSARAALAAPKPKKRKMHALALLVDFSDNPGTRPAAEFHKLLFAKSNPNSMTNFYKAMSYGAIEVSGEVINYVRAPQPYNYYTAGESGTGDTFPRNTPGLLQDALTIFCQTDNLKRFDTDGDGFVDGIFLIHAGGGAEAEPNPAKRKDMIWSHKWTLPRPFVNQNVKVFAYSTEPEDGKVGVFSHEFGHVLGLPDLYDTTYRSHGTGDWCLMSAGSWGGGGDRPARMSCWCLSTLGWIKPKVFTKRRTVKLKSLEKTKTACYRLWSGGAAGPEYFLIENRQATGLDKSLPGSGLAVWHIDERQSDNTNPLDYEVALVQADGRRDMERLRNQGDDSDLFPGSKNVTKIDDQTTPSTRAVGGATTGVALDNIAMSKGVVSVRAKA